MYFQIIMSLLSDLNVTKHCFDPQRKHKKHITADLRQVPPDIKNKWNITARYTPTIYHLYLDIYKRSCSEQGRGEDPDPYLEDPWKFGWPGTGSGVFP